MVYERWLKRNLKRSLLFLRLFFPPTCPMLRPATSRFPFLALPMKSMLGVSFVTSVLCFYNFSNFRFSSILLESFERRDKRIFTVSGFSTCNSNNVQASKSCQFAEIRENLYIRYHRFNYVDCRSHPNEKSLNSSFNVISSRRSNAIPKNKRNILPEI